MNDIKSMTMQSFMSYISPPSEAKWIGAYLTAAARALGGRSDADLARTIGVSPATIANWKRRGIIPEDAQAWFRTTLVEKIATYSRDLRPVSQQAREAVVRLLIETNGNPLHVKRAAEAATSHALAGLLVLAEFLCDLSHIDRASSSEPTPSLIAALLGNGMMLFRRGDQFRQYEH